MEKTEKKIYLGDYMCKKKQEICVKTQLSVSKNEFEQQTPWLTREKFLAMALEKDAGNYRH